MTWPSPFIADALTDEMKNDKSASGDETTSFAFRLHSSQ
jgi:hypothetical protein